VTVGVFDGVHRGHRTLLRELGAWAREGGVDPVVVTFDAHPRTVLTGQGPPLITGLEHRLGLLAREGERGVVVKNHRFGRERRGDFALLGALGAAHGFEAREVELEIDDDVISSTAIRERIAAGDLAGASELLGRPVALLGRVVPGDRRGRTLGFPTANLEPGEAARPPRGVWAAWARVTDDPLRLDGPQLPAVVNVGRRPTWYPEGALDLVEAHLLEPPPGELYGRWLELSFAARLREERRFAGPDQLVAQIARDVVAARELLAAAAR
jgi:riboflavin kinase/FMN adenylyltransferase